MRFRKVIARWNNEKNEGVIKYQIGEIIVTLENGNSTVGYDAHFLIPGILDRYANFRIVEGRPLCKIADVDIADMIRSRIESWYPLEVLLKEESENVEIAKTASLKELEEALLEKELKREEIREEWEKKMYDYKGLARVWRREVKEHDTDNLLIEVVETEEGLILLTRFKGEDDVYQNRLHNVYKSDIISQDVELTGEITVEEAIEWHYRYAELDRKEKRQWERYVHPYMPNYEQVIQEELKGE